MSASSRSAGRKNQTGIYLLSWEETSSQKQKFRDKTEVPTTKNVDYCTGNRQEYISCKRKETKRLLYVHILLLMQGENSCTRNEFPVVRRQFLSGQKFPVISKQEKSFSH